MGNLKLLQDLHNKNQSSQTRLRFVVCLVYFVGLVDLVRRRGKSVTREIAGRAGRAGNAGLSRLFGLFGLSGLSGASELERRDKRDCANLNEQRMAGHVRRLTELRIALRSVAAFPFHSSPNGFGKVCGRGSEEEERTDQEIHGDGRIARFHFGDAGLAGPKPLCQLDLGQAFLLPPCTQTVAEP